MRTPRIGIQIDFDDAFWMQVNEVMWQRAYTRSAELIELNFRPLHTISDTMQAEVLEDLIAQELDALITNVYPISLLTAILERGIPIVHVTEIALYHPRFCSRKGLYDAALIIGAQLAERLPPHSTLLVVGGGATGDDTGQSRLDGFAKALEGRGPYIIHQLPSNWEDAPARLHIETYARKHAGLHFDAIFGLSDSLALCARELFLEHGQISSEALIFGINGDPLALAGIAQGTMMATVETDVDDIATQAIDLAYRAALGERIPALFQPAQRLVTQANVAEAATRKMLSLATLPSRLVDTYRRNTLQRAVQIETGQAIDRQVGQLLDEQQLSAAIIALIRDNYGFDYARFLLWHAPSKQLIPVGRLPAAGETADLAPDAGSPLAYAVQHDQPVFIPDTAASQRFVPDPLWPEARTRVVMPVHLGGQIIGMLDLHRHVVTHYTRDELYNLQVLADRIGISMRNAELYGEAVRARAAAEQADQLKTVLLANVSHELRTPLNVILGYSAAALENPARYQAQLPSALLADIQHIHHSGQHLTRVINDLLDLSRAEINELDLAPEVIDTRAFLADVFHPFAHSQAPKPAFEWRLELPEELPAISADGVRLRQILLNLLSNASKFTASGSITLGAAHTPGRLHLWVRDTGVGIAAEQQARVFEPFVTGVQPHHRNTGIGLGLAITRRLVALHGGAMALESQPGQGSTFHIYLPLPATPAPASPNQPALLLISEAVTPPASILELAARRGLAVQQAHPKANFAPLLASPPALLAWDLADTTASSAVIEHIRARPQLSQVPVMFYQSDASAPSEQRGGATGLLLKPMGDRALIEALSTLDPQQPHGSILIVEDDAHTRALHWRLVSEQFPSYTVHTASNGRAALEAIAQQIPSMIVLDLIMPDVDGFAVLEALRADPRTAVLPVLVLSGRALTTADVQRLGAARVMFQTKDTLSESSLAEAMRRTLNRTDQLPPHTSALVKQAIAFIQQHHNEPLSRQNLADAIGMSKDYLGRIFHQELGLSPWEYLIRYRVVRAKELLRTTDYTIAEVAARVGFDTATYFSHIFHREVGCSPREFRAQRTL